MNIDIGFIVLLYTYLAKNTWNLFGKFLKLLEIQKLPPANKQMRVLDYLKIEVLKLSVC